MKHEVFYFFIQSYFVRPTLFCSGQGFVIAERSLAVISIDLWGKVIAYNTAHSLGLPSTTI